MRPPIPPSFFYDVLIIGIVAALIAFFALRADAQTTPCAERDGGALECTAPEEPETEEDESNAVLAFQSGAIGLDDTNGKQIGVSLTNTYFDELDLPDWMVWRVAAGAWADNNYFNSNYTGYVGFMVGYQVTPSFFYLQILNGPTYITDTDDRLGTHFQLHTNASAGMRYDGLRLGVAYSHFSNGGIGKPNLGRDYVGIELGFEF